MAMRALFCVFSLTACAASPALPSSTSAPLVWLEGCWVTDDGNTTERWKGETRDIMFGQSVTVKDGTLAFFEQLRIQAGDGGLTLSAYPQGQGPTDFQQITKDEQRITFANDTHDYPQRITYARKGQMLTASISLKDGRNASEWRYRPCD